MRLHGWIERRRPRYANRNKSQHVHQDVHYTVTVMPRPVCSSVPDRVIHFCITWPAAARPIELLCAARNVWSHAAIALNRPDVHYHLLAIDFLPASLLHASLRRLSTALAAGQLQPLPDVAHDVSSSAAALRQLSKVNMAISDVETSAC